jgi:hypothetical protein
MNAPAYTVTIHGQARYEHAAPDFGIHCESAEGSISNQPFSLLSDAVAAAEMAIATGIFHYNQMALGFCCQGVSVHDASGVLIFSGLVAASRVQWIPPRAQPLFNPSLQLLKPAH